MIVWLELYQKPRSGAIIGLMSEKCGCDVLLLMVVEGVSELRL